MPLFRRKESKQDVADADSSALGELGEDAEEVEYGSVPEPADEVPAPTGPWDVADAPQDDSPRLDLGGLQVPGFAGMELRLEVDRATDRVIAATAVAHGGQLQLQAFAAPRRDGIWAEVQAEIVEGVTAGGGSVEEAVGRFGTELVAQVPGDTPADPLQPARFVGVDGPRWFLRGVFSGAAATPGEAADLLEQVFAGTRVVRGDAAMAPRDLLALRMPDQVTAARAAEAGEAGEAEEAPDADSSGAEDRPPLEPFRRGPEITEIH